MRFARARSAIVIAAACLLSPASPARSQSRPGTVPSLPSSVPQDPVRLHLQALGARGSVVEQARDHVIAILSTENSCTAWFREADPDVAATFKSLEFSVDDGPRVVVAFKSAWGETLLKHPYSAGVQENAGRNATVLLNSNGPFFAKVADVLVRDATGSYARVAGRRMLRVGSYAGNTLPARITTLLHELAHVIGRIPDDSDELSGLSMQNTQRVLHACRAEIKSSARQHSDATRVY
jgi:hypothetical protein